MGYDIKNRYFGRRQFLVGVGGHMLLLPLLSSLLPAELARAATSVPQRNLCLFPSFYGMYSKYIQPSAAVVAPYLKNHKPGIDYASLSSLPKPISFIVDANYNPLLSYVNIFKGLDFTSDYGHTYGMFAGVGRIVVDGHVNRLPAVGKSIDVIVEQSAAFKSSFQGKFPTLRISGTSMNGKASTSVDRDTAGNAISLPFVYGDQSLFNKLFATSTTPTTGTPLSQRKMLVADSIREDLTRLKNLRRISAEDKQMLDRFVTGVDDLQRNLQTSNSLSCSQPTLSFQINSAGSKVSNASAAKYYANIFDMALLAMACGQSRMFHMMSFLANDTFGGYLHHAEDTINNEGSDGQYWLLQQVLKFAQKLQAFPDPSGQGNMLDQSLLLFCQEHEHRTAHSHKNLPIMSIGKLGGSVTSGNFIQYTGPVKGYPMKMLLITLMQAMGVTKTEWMKEGDGNGFGYWGSEGDKNYSSLKTIANDPLPLFTQGT